MKRHHFLISSLISVITLAASGAALAQPGGCGMGGHPGPGMGPGAGMGAPMGQPADPAQRLGELKAALKITPAQESAWTQFENTLKQQAQTRQAVREQMRAQMQAAQASGSQPDVAAQRASMQKMREAHQAEHRAAWQALYAVLTPEQKALADQRMRHAGMRPGHHARRDCPGA